MAEQVGQVGQGVTTFTIPVGAVKVRSKGKGRQVDPTALAEVEAVLGAASMRRDLLIEHLHCIQDRFGHLSDRHLAALASLMRLALAEVYEVATFYHHFDVVREGEAVPPALTVRVCASLSCEMAGARDLLERLPGLLGVDVRVLAAPCVGRCDVAPVVVVHRNPILHATAEAVAEAVALGATEHPLSKSTEAALVKPLDHAPTLEAAPPHVDYAAYRKAGGYRLATACTRGEKKREDIFTLLENAGLRGLGGAGFPTGRKWRIVAAEPAPRLMAVNIDEGEPGTFKDRHYLERDPHRFLEGVLIAAWAVDVAEVYIYLRDEYHGVRALLEQELSRLQAEPPCRLPVIHLRRGAGAYICG
jgi:formate dehydrogenase